MYYLNCKYCHQYTAVNSQYTTFCENCGKKFAVSYGDWLKEQSQQEIVPDSLHFEAYLKVYGLPLEALPRTYKRRSSPKTYRRLFVMASICVLLLIFSGVGAWYGPKIVRYWNQSGVSSEYKDYKHWRHFKSGALLFETPLSLTPQPIIDLPTQRIRNFVAGSRLDGMVLQFQEKLYMDLPILNLHHEAASFIEVFSKESGVDQVKFEQHPIRIQDQVALLQEGTYRSQKSIAMGFTSLILTQGGTSYQIVIRYGAHDETAKQVANRLINSLKVNG